MRTDLHKPALGLVNPRADIGGETIAYEFYHAINVGAAAGNVFFFQNAGGLAPLLSNWEFGNQSAFSAGNAFSLYGVGFDVVFTPSTVAEDAAAAFGDLTTLNQFARVATFRLRVESKDYLDVPVMRLSAGSGITSQGIAVDVAQILKQPYCEIGEAGARAIYTMKPGIYLGPLYQFQAVLNLDAALAKTISVRCYLMGFWTRNIQ